MLTVPRSSRAGVLLAAALACAAVAGGVAPRPALATIYPVAQCLVPEAPAAGTYTLRYGYVNDGGASVGVPEGPTNFLSLTSVNYSPPTVFLPGWHPAALTIREPNDDPPRWTVNGTVAAPQHVAKVTSTSSLYVPSTPECGLTFQGDYSGVTTYLRNDIVQNGGASWVLTAATSVDAAPAAPDWAVLAAKGAAGAAGDPGAQGEPGAQGQTGATGDPGPQGDPGVRGETGAPGPQGDTGARGDTGPAGAAGPRGDTGAAGPAGPKGDPGDTGPRGDTGPAGATAAKAPQRFDAHGRITVKDRSITASSVIVIQYADPTHHIGAPSNVLTVKAGSFRASGTPRARFRYVVYKP